MCGIAGAWVPEAAEAQAEVQAMCMQMIARGPDDGGTAQIETSRGALVLGNRRLAIIDPTPLGHQPMLDEARGNVCVFNGMIYNHAELRSHLSAQGERFMSDCDSEVVLKAFGRFGRTFVDHLRGMFAIAIWDASNHELLLARDRLGIKPLYYWQRNDSFLFASQVKALLNTGVVPARLSPAAIASYLAYGAVSEPFTAIDGVRALPAGCIATLRDGYLDVNRYWQPRTASRAHVNRGDAADELRARLQDSVRCHLVSDAPIGVFLSGGLDSSALAALAARETPHVRTVSVNFDDVAYSEGRFAEAVAAHIGSHHQEVTLRAADLIASRDDIFRAMDQPTFDGMNTYAVSQAAAGAGLKVALCGIGADELFDGYGYVRRARVLERARIVPRPLAALAGRALSTVASGPRSEKAIAWLLSEARPSGASSYDLMRRLFLDRDVSRVAPGQPPPSPPIQSAADDVASRLSALDLEHYTRNVLLRDTDAMSMAHSLEVRVPYLDTPVVEWALSLPASAKGQRKALLVEATSDLLPAEVVSRKKQGFVLPLARWMREELRDDVSSSLQDLPDELGALLDRRAVIDVWQRFLYDGQGWLRPWALYALARWSRSITSPLAVAA